MFERVLNTPLRCTISKYEQNNKIGAAKYRFYFVFIQRAGRRVKGPSWVFYQRLFSLTHNVCSL